MNHSFACGIEDHDDNTFIITGGLDFGVTNTTNKVVKYSKTGKYTDLPPLNIARIAHGCGSYKNSFNQKVKMIVC